MDIAVPVGLLMSGKDETELSLTQQACNVTCSVWSKYLRKEIIEIVDAEKVIDQFHNLFLQYI